MDFQKVSYDLVLKLPTPPQSHDCILGTGQSLHLWPFTVPCGHVTMILTFLPETQHLQWVPLSNVTKKVMKSGTDMWGLTLQPSQFMTNYGAQL